MELSFDISLISSILSALYFSDGFMRIILLPACNIEYNIETQCLMLILYISQEIMVYET